MYLSCTLQDFYKTEVQCTKLYVHYVYKLYDLHVEAENHTEAGFTLKLHAELLSWSDQVLPKTPDSRYPEQQEWQRKETIYQHIIDNFNRGKVVFGFWFIVMTLLNLCNNLGGLV